MKDYLQKIRTEFPELVFTKIKYVDRGWDNDVVVVDDHLVFRFPKRETYSKRFRSEVGFLKQIAPLLNLKVPSYTHLSKDHSFGAYPIILGTELTPELFHTLSLSAKEQIYNDLAEFLTRLHNVSSEIAKGCGFDSNPDGYHWSFANTVKRYELVKSQFLDDLDSHIKEFIIDSYVNYLSCSFDFELVICHGDLSSDHIFVDSESKISGIIDFADCDLSDPAIDFTCFWYYGEEFVNEVYERYRGQKSSHFIQRSKMPYLMHATGNLLEIAQGVQIPLSVKRCQEILIQKMNSGLRILA